MKERASFGGKIQHFLPHVPPASLLDESAGRIALVDG
jgi:hypothetical protein